MLYTPALMCYMPCISGLAGAWELYLFPTVAYEKTAMHGDYSKLNRYSVQLYLGVSIKH